MRPEKAALIEYLKTKTAGALVMTPAELSMEIRVSPKQQSKLRREGSFPIQHQQAGRTVLYSVFAVADFIFDGSSTQSPPQAKIAAPHRELPPNGSRARKKGTDMSHLFLLRGFLASLRDQKANIDTLCRYFERYVKAAPMAEALEAALPQKARLTGETSNKTKL